MNELTTIEGVILGFSLIGFVMAFYGLTKVPKHVSRDKVIEEKSMEKLFSSNPPPRRVLTDKGKKLHTIYITGVAIFFLGAIILLVMNIGQGSS